LIILNQAKAGCLKVFSKNILNIVRETSLQLSEGKKIDITCSIGCTYLPLHPELMEVFKLEQLINFSDLAMYKAKEMGRNRAVHINF
jgi:GGDEF domain-containing protein